MENEKPRTKSNKGKEKKLLRKQELERERAAKDVIDAAYKIPDQLNFAPLFRTYTRSGCDLDLVASKQAELDDATREWCFALTERNMKELYEKTWGWDERKKKSELFDESALYLIARERESRRSVAFVHYRFLYEEDKRAEVLYLYEIQVESDYQSKGVGRFLMVILQLLASKNKMKFVMMTVFKMNFYTTHLKYTLDELSPRPADPEPHLILSKPVL